MGGSSLLSISHLFPLCGLLSQLHLRPLDLSSSGHGFIIYTETKVTGFPSRIGLGRPMRLCAALGACFFLSPSLSFFVCIVSTVFPVLIHGDECPPSRDPRRVSQDGAGDELLLLEVVLGLSLLPVRLYREGEAPTDLSCLPLSVNIMLGSQPRRADPHTRTVYHELAIASSTSLKMGLSAFRAR